MNCEALRVVLGFNTSLQVMRLVPISVAITISMTAVFFPTPNGLETQTLHKSKSSDILLYRDRQKYASQVL